MTVLERLAIEAKKSPKKVVLPEATDERTLKAAEHLYKEGLAHPILIGNPADVKSVAKEKGIDIEGIEIVNPLTSDLLDAAAKHLHERRKNKGMTEEVALKTVKQPLYFGASMLALNKADSCVTGAVHTTGDVLRSALFVIGLKLGSNVVSSVFLMTLQDGRTLTYGDCAVVPYPDVHQLATIARDSAESHKKLVGEEPKVAMLSFSTKGSAEHPNVFLVQQALEQVKTENPGLMVDGELQFDAAFVPSIGARKAPGSEVAGQANVFVFPNLDAGNIGYKITERLAGAKATGPIIQGLAKPMMDLSRGASWQDIVNTALVSMALV
ncbi:phosphate acetyltransferase [bacterium]|nr:MAG: phosphate acetyltransferase [bacterium]